MPRPVLLFLIGTRAELLASASAWRALAGEPQGALPFEPRLVVTGQERTEMDQTLAALDIEPNGDLEVMRPYLADANLDSALIDAGEVALRHHRASAVVVAGTSASAWGAVVSAYFKSIPVLRIEQGTWPAEGERPMPEWLHTPVIRRMAALHLCADERCAGWLREAGADALAPGAEIAVTGDTMREMLAESLRQGLALPEDPALAGLRRDAPRVLVYMRRREHHGDGLRPLCEALGTAAGRFADHEFLAFSSLQMHVCDAMKALLPDCGNVRMLCPMPHPLFVRELARMRLVVTDSVGVAQEALGLGRPVLMPGRCGLTRGLLAAAGETGTFLAAVEMDSVALAEAIAGALESPAPVGAPDHIAGPDGAGRRMAEILLQWWKKHDIGLAPR